MKIMTLLWKERGEVEKKRMFRENEQDSAREGMVGSR